MSRDLTPTSGPEPKHQLAVDRVMTSHLTEPCKTCDGAGRVPRPRRKLPNGEPDRFDTIDWPEVVCETCTGSGRVPLDPQSIKENTPAGF